MTSLALGMTVLLAACEIEKVAIPQTEQSLVVHGVLSASMTSQVVLLERTRGGTVASFDLGDTDINPLLAESNAIVQLTTPDGRTLLGREDISAPESKGEGIGLYRFALPGDSLVRGGAYSLKVTTTFGEILRAGTFVPGGTAAIAAEPRVFNRATDTLLITWPASAGARSYFVRVETPYGPRSFFTDSTHVRLTGELRNVDAKALPRVFIPGFPQAITVSAVDSNYYDWFRTHNERISGVGLVSRVEGGLGVFGSLVRLRYLDLRVVAPQPAPTAGEFIFDGTQLDQSITPYLRLELYLESPSARADQSDALSGRYDRRPFLGMRGCVTCGLLGTVRDGRIELAFLSDWSARDTTETFSGEIRGDTIVGRYGGLGLTARFVRRP